MRVGSAALLAMAWIALLFLVAALTQRHARRTGGHMRGRHGAYTLALGVYCSSWTIYGAVGSAVRTGWDYLPVYLAPILLLLAAPLSAPHSPRRGRGAGGHPLRLYRRAFRA
jgi:Na+/proline symporter